MKKVIAPLVLSIILLSSCLTKIALNNLGVFEKSVSVKFITNNKKQIVFLPMHHIGTSEFYKDEARIVDSLVQKGYSVFYEAVNKGNITDELLFDTLKLKFRKITGIPKNSKGKTGLSIDTVNNTLFGKKSKLVTKYNLRNQGLSYFKKYDSTKVINVDASISEMIFAYEKKYGVIVLNKNDFDVKFGDSYKHRESKEKRNFFTIETRNNIVTNVLMKSNANKIVLVYGSAHFNGIFKNLQAEDKNYKEVDKF